MAWLLKCDEEEKKSLIDVAGNEARVKPGGGRFSPRWSATPKRLNGVTHAACSLVRSLVGHRANSSIAPNYDLHSVMTLLVAVASRPSPVTTLRVDRSMSSCTLTCDAWRGLTCGKLELNEARTSGEFINRFRIQRRSKHTIFFTR